MALTLRGLFTWRFLQTDPNTANFLYDNNADKCVIHPYTSATRLVRTSFVNVHTAFTYVCFLFSQLNRFVPTS